VLLSERKRKILKRLRSNGKLRIEQAEQWANYLLNRFPELRAWSCVVDYSRQDEWVGLCYYETSTILLDWRHVLRDPDFEVKDTILHEIAHALVKDEPEEHGPLWEAKALEIGVSYKEICRYRYASVEDAEIVAESGCKWMLPG